MTTHPLFRWLQRGLLILGLLLLALWAKGDLESRVFQSVESKRLDVALREAGPGPDGAVAGFTTLAGPAEPHPFNHAAGQPGVLGKLDIPRLHIRAIVAEGFDARTLNRAVGHCPSTALPGRPGNCALAGHRDTFLRGLGGIRSDDVIRITTLDRTYTYHVDWTMVVEPRRVDVLDSTATPSLTLITCYPFAFVGHAPRRFVVRATQVAAVTTALPDEERGQSASR